MLMSRRVMNGAAKQRCRPQPLDIAPWLKAIGNLRADVAVVPDNSKISRLIRRAYHLSLISPDPFWPLFSAPSEEKAFESSLDGECLSTSLDQLINPALVVVLSKPNGKFEATVRVCELGLAGRGAGPDRARATLTAWCDCISLMHAELERMMGSFKDPDPHRSRSSQDRSSTWH